LRADLELPYGIAIATGAAVGLFRNLVDGEADVMATLVRQELWLTLI
jgi:hypothetical protein